MGQADGRIQGYRATLVRLRDDFLAHATVTTEQTVLCVRDDVRNIIIYISKKSNDRRGYV